MSYVIKSGNTYYRSDGGPYGSAVYRSYDATQYMSKESAEAWLSDLNDFWRKTAYVVDTSCIDDATQSVLAVSSNGAGEPEQNDGKDSSYYNFPEGHEGNPYAMVDHERYPYWVRVAFVELYKATTPMKLPLVVGIADLCLTTDQSPMVFSAMQGVYRYGQGGDRNSALRDLNKAEWYIQKQIDHTETTNLRPALYAIKRAQEELS